jgi:hypothetical protein
MPTISEFFGIMYYDDHNPPHFHAYYQDHQAIVLIETLIIAQGSLPRRAQALVLEWASDHREELIEDWRLAAEHQPLNLIQPLE